ncbi:hypothetical protein [Candidatus Palauibacter soopunensis]|uniref:hypothetical protein n=1 Tax=Candidatus Palauibacter soopunensis TaxID=3056739 RepID=UPI002393871F|nr:hypothetical protein [Candidatus Palauibacter soopunensis]MDE2878008.1 hypothetical protein [Candidatus Palauibacter soopunensis]
MNRRDQSRDGGRGPGWAEYLEPLRPDELTRRRLRRNVMAAAEALFARRPLSWLDVTASWSAALAPLAAGLLVAAGVLLYRISLPDAPEFVVDPDPTPVGLVRSLAPDAEAPPALLIDLAEPSRDAVLTAALINP